MSKTWWNFWLGLNERKREMNSTCDPKKPRLNPEQHNMIMRCSEEKDFTEWNERRKKSPEEEIWLQKANFRNAHLKDVDLNSAHLEGADLHSAHCEGANFQFAHCEGANFQFAHCEGADFLRGWYKWADFRSAHCEGAHFRGAHCEGADFKDAHCEGTHFSHAHCEGAAFYKAHCEGAHFRGAHCEGTNFSQAHCEEANFILADCSGAKFVFTKCQGTQFISTIVDHRTHFLGCEIDSETDFTTSSLASMSVEPGVRAKLEQNIRRKSWKEWYGPGWWRKIYTSPVRLFWLISIYGYSTIRPLLCFLLAALCFTAIYTYSPTLLKIGTNSLPLLPTASWLGKDIADPLQMFAFALSTMVTLGFSNINVAVDDTNHASFWGTLVVCSNLLTGYFFLAVIVTRLGVLFQTLAPGHIPKPPEDETKSPDTPTAPPPKAEGGINPPPSSSSPSSP